MSLPRVLLGLLVAANLVYLVWTLGGLAVFGTEPERMRQAEPQRLAQQIRPGALRVRAPGESRPASAPAPVSATVPTPSAPPAPAPVAAAAAAAATSALAAPAAPEEPVLSQQFDHR